MNEHLTIYGTQHGHGSLPCLLCAAQETHTLLTHSCIITSARRKIKGLSSLQPAFLAPHFQHPFGVTPNRLAGQIYDSVTLLNISDLVYKGTVNLARFI